MPITLVEVAKEIAQAAAAVDRHIDEAYRQRFLAAFADAEGDEGREPLAEKLRPNGRDVDVPRLTLVPQQLLDTQEVEISLSSDVELEGRQFHLPQWGYLRFRKGTSETGNVGLNQRIDASYGRYTSAQLTDQMLPLDGDTSLWPDRIIYRPQDSSLFLGLHPGSAPAVLEMLRDGLVSLQPVTEEDDIEATVLDCRDASAWAPSFRYGVLKVPEGALDWLQELPDNTIVELGAYNAARERAIERLVGEQIDATVTPSVYDIMVTLQQGLDPNAAHLEIRCKFVRREAPEGAGQVNDAMVQALTGKLA